MLMRADHIIGLASACTLYSNHFCLILVPLIVIVIMAPAADDPIERGKVRSLFSLVSLKYHLKC